MKLLPSLFIKSTKDTRPSSSSSSSSWPWPSCKQPKTFSFRADNIMLKTVNSVYIDAGDVGTTKPESWFTNSSESPSFSTESDDSGGEWVETIIRGSRSERLFFEPGDSNSILEEAKAGGFPFKESVMLAMESEDPYVDFRTSMEEMVEAHGLKDWEHLEELLGWYLRVNGKKIHGFIVGAFVDLLVGLAAADASSSSSSSSSPSSPFSSSLRIEEEIEEKDSPSSSEI